MFGKVKFAPVAPLWLLDQMTDIGPYVIGPYHLLLAHDVLEKAAAFSAWATELRILHATHTRNSDVTIIMDSSVIELGHPMSLSDCMEAARIVSADVVVLPDIIGEHKDTLRYVDEADVLLRTLPLAPEIMFVPQGRTLEEYVASIEAVANIEWIQWLGLPRDALQFMKSRMDLVLACKILAPKKKIHMLGFSDNVLDDFICCTTGAVHGIDSAVPVRAGMKGTHFKLSINDYGKRENYWTDEKPITSQAVSNITSVRRWLAPSFKQ